MEAGKKRNIAGGERYSHLFPEATKQTSTIRKDANVYHTAAFIPKVVQDTLDQTAGIAAILKGSSLRETCRNIWEFVYRHIAYRKDADGYEQIRSPARAWHDRFEGVDCDCYSVFISSILTNLKIPHTLRITKYSRDYFQHIYPVVPSANGQITIDCVTDKFDYEVPFSEKKDYPMDLQYLNGFEDTDGGMEELGKVIQQRFSGGARRTPPAKHAPVQHHAPSHAPAKHAAPAHTVKNAPHGVKHPAAAKSPGVSPAIKKKKGFKKVINKVNKINPATVALRNGILASMKLNIKNAAKRLRWSYLSAQEATAKGINSEKFQKLISIRHKLEKILYTAGGKPDNLRKAILQGKGNKDRSVHGLEGIDGFVQYMNEYSPIQDILGQEIHYSENVEGMDGLGELGEPLTLSSIAAASGVIAGIVGMLKQVGDIFNKKTKNSEDFDEQKNAEAEKEETAEPVTPAPALPEVPDTPNPAIPKENEGGSSNNNNGSGNSEQAYSPANVPAIFTKNLPAAPDDGPVEKSIMKSGDNEDDENKLVKSGSGGKADADPDSSNEGFWDKNKKWLKPIAIGVGGVSVIIIGVKLLKSKHTSAPAKTASKALHGIPKGKRKKNHHRGKPAKRGKRTAIALM